MASAHDPRVLRLIERSVSAAHDAGITIEVCGEAASDPLMVPLLVGLGVDELSVGAARVGSVRRWIRNLSLEHVGRLARSVLALRTVEEVTDAASALASELEADSAHSVNGGRERLQRGGRVHALGA
jgi:phosphoenolpyruvate-protein kinase (PTS system EI component)